MPCLRCEQTLQYYGAAFVRARQRIEIPRKQYKTLSFLGRRDDFGMTKRDAFPACCKATLFFNSNTPPIKP